MSLRRNDEGQALCEYADMTPSPCFNPALWLLVVDGDEVGLTCEDHAQEGFKVFHDVKKSRVQLKSLATGRLITLAEALNVA